MKRQFVLPIFYHVEPTDVRHQRANFAQALHVLEECFAFHRDKVVQWRRALTEAASLSGWHLVDAHFFTEP